MRAGFVSSLILLLQAFFVTQTVVAEEPKSEAYKAYKAQAGAIAANAIEAELSKHPDRPIGARLELTFQVDLEGRVHEANVVSSKADEWAQGIARHVLADLKLPAISEKLAAGLRGTWVHVEAALEVGVIHTGNKSVSRDSPDTVAYLREIDSIICSVLDAEAVKRHSLKAADLTITLIIDRDGRVRGQEIVSVGRDAWPKETAARVIRTAKLPHMSKKVAAEHKDGLVAFRTHWTYQKD